jgi:uncharacterized protein YndB with AHSA1/START domain
MNTLDQRILIPAAPQLVWETLSDLAHLDDWFSGYDGVSFLNSVRNGPGARLRLTSTRERDLVLEVVAWYNGLGFEYVIVEGSAVRENRARVRLQELPEGTVVQWTFTYEAGGLFGGRFGLNTAIERQMEESLKALYRIITQKSKDKRFEAKSLMRDDPGVEARAQYRPRHTPVGRADDAFRPDTGPSEPVFPSARSAFAPAPTEAVFVPSPVQPAPQTAPPAFDSALPPPDADDTRPTRAVVPVSAPSPFAEPAFLADLEPLSAPPAAPSHVQEHTPAPVPSPAPVPPRPVYVPPPAPVTSADETYRSVFEIFGVARPSETQGMPAVTVPPAAGQTTVQADERAPEPAQAVETAQTSAAETALLDAPVPVARAADVPFDLNPPSSGVVLPVVAEPLFRAASAETAADDAASADTGAGGAEEASTAVSRAAVLPPALYPGMGLRARMRRGAGGRIRG